MTKTQTKMVSNLEKILNKDYDCEIPDQKRSKDFCSEMNKLIKNMFPDCIVQPRNCYCEPAGLIRKDNNTVEYIFNDFRYKNWQKNILVRNPAGWGRDLADIDEFETTVRCRLEGGVL